MSKKILILAETLDVDSSSAGKACNAFIKSLAAEDFYIIAYHYSHKEININSVQTILIKENRKDIYYFLSRSQRVFQRLTKNDISKKMENRFGFSFTFKNDVNGMVKAMEHENPSDYDLIITLSKGASYRTHAALLKLPKWHNKWLAYIHDPYPFHWYPPPYEWTEAGCVKKEWFFVQIAHKSKWLGYPSQRLAEWMGQFDNAFLKKAVVLPHQMPRNKTENSTPLPSFYLKDKFTVLHAGNLLKQRNPFPLIAAWKRFLEEIPEAKKCSQLLLIGPSSYHQPKLSAIHNTIPSIFVSEGNMNYEEVLQMETEVTVNIVLEAVSEISPFLPAKFPGLVKANRPIFHLGPVNSESRRLLGIDYEYVAAADDVIAIKGTLKSCFVNWKSNDFQLNRGDLNEYFSSSYLKKIVDSLV
ncbi:UDP-glycosyltransferase [Aequorivita flava]|uniref:UDP-glycosyltransferase n=1 Tax=Aequorivita flava TaxID=3114371 RepID=A0AB35YUL5_9FLAO